MFYQVYQFIALLFKFDGYYHVAKRAVSLSNILGHFGVACIEYGKQKVEVIWTPQVPPSYIEELIKLDPTAFTSDSSLRRL